MIVSKTVERKGDRYQILSTGEGVYLVSSKSKPGLWHKTEELTPGLEYACDCQAFQYRGECSHMYAVVAAFVVPQKPLCPKCGQEPASASTFGKPGPGRICLFRAMWGA